MKHLLIALCALTLGICDFTFAASADDTDAPQVSAIKSIRRVSTNSAGRQADGDNYSPAFSPDGTLLAFESDATNLVAGDTNGKSDVFVKNLATGRTVRVSTTAGGVQGNGYSYGPVFSPDGKMVIFVSDATNLVPGDTNGMSDIFAKTLATGAIRRISTRSDGTQSNGVSWGPAVSPDGKRITFSSEASNLVAGDTNGVGDIFVKTLAGGAVIRVSTTAAGGNADGPSDESRFSPDAKSVLFWSDASNLVAADTNTAPDIFLKTLATGAIRRLTVNVAGKQGNNDSYSGRFAPDGKSVVFDSWASNLVAGDTNLEEDIFVKTLAGGAVARVSVRADGTQGNERSCVPVYSPTGDRIAFESEAGNFVAGDTNAALDVFVKTLATKVLKRVSTRADGGQGDLDSWGPVFSPDGKHVAFVSNATNLVAGDTNARADIFVVELASP